MFAAALDQPELGAFNEAGRMKGMLVHGVFADAIEIPHVSGQFRRHIFVS